MFLLGSALAAVAFLIPPASERPASGFDLARCSVGATDIVVTDRDGRVRECWRGELKPGDVVGLGAARLTPANALPWECSRLRTERALSGLYRLPLPDELRYRRHHAAGPLEPLVWPAAPEVADTEFRLVLFLRKGGTTGGGAVWMPATVPPVRQRFYMGSRRNWYPGCEGRPLPPIDECWDADIDFTKSVAWAEAGRVVVWQSGQFVPVALTLDHFKADALARPGPPANALKWDELPLGPATLAEDPAVRILSGGLR